MNLDKVQKRANITGREEICLVFLDPQILHWHGLFEDPTSVLRHKYIRVKS